MRNYDEVVEEVKSRINDIERYTEERRWLITKMPSERDGQRIGKGRTKAISNGHIKENDPESVGKRKQQLLKSIDDVTKAAIAHDINNLVGWMTQVSFNDLLWHMNNTRPGESCCISGVCDFTEDDLIEFYKKLKSEPIENPEKIAQTIYGNIIKNGILPTEEDIATAEDKIYFYEQGDSGRSRQITRAARLKLLSGRGEFDGNGLPIDLADELSDEIKSNSRTRELDQNRKSRASKPIHDMLMEAKNRTLEFQKRKGEDHTLKEEDLNAVFDFLECRLEDKAYVYKGGALEEVLRNYAFGMAKFRNGETMSGRSGRKLAEIDEIVNNSRYLTHLFNDSHVTCEKTNNGTKHVYSVDKQLQPGKFLPYICYEFFSQSDHGTTVAIRNEGEGETYTAFSDKVGSKAYQKAYDFCLRQPTILERIGQIISAHTPIWLNGAYVDKKDENNWVSIE